MTRNAERCDYGPLFTFPCNFCAHILLPLKEVKKFFDNILTTQEVMRVFSHVPRFFCFAEQAERVYRLARSVVSRH